MAIEGPIRELALADVLQLVHLSRKTGRLSAWREARSRPARLFFDQGAVVGVESAGDGSRLGRLLLLAGKATAAQVEGALAAQRAAPGRRLGALLAEEGGVPATEIERQLRFQVEEALFDLLRWTEGHFRFEEATPPDPGPIRLRVGTDALLLEGMRRTDEWSELASGRPDTTLVPRLVEQGAAGAMLKLAPAEWEALAAIDGARTLRQVAHELGRAEFEVARAVFSLASTGLVELGRAAPAVAPRKDPAAALHAALAEVERELGVGRLEAAERALGEVEARHPARAEPRIARGRLALRRGRWVDAVSALESAVRLDPLAAEAYLWLGRARVRAGDLEGAAEALATGARLSEGEAGERAARAAALLVELRSLLEEER